MGAHLGSDTKAQAAFAGALHIPRSLRHGIRAAGEGYSDIGADFHRLGRGGGEGQRQERVMLGFKRPHALKAHCLQAFRLGTNLAQVHVADLCVYLHDEALDSIT